MSAPTFAWPTADALAFSVLVAALVLLYGLIIPAELLGGLFR